MPADQPESRHLRCFVAVAEAGSFRAAARRLGLSQPTVSEHVASLERTLGFAVFERAGRRILVTEEGRLLLPRAQRVVREMATLAEGIGEAVEAGAGRLTIGAIPTMSPFLLPPVLAGLREEFPHCELVVIEDLTDHLLDRLDDHEIDLAVLSPPVDHPRIVCETLGRERMLVVMPADSGGEPPGSLTLGDLRGRPRVSLSGMHCLGTQIESFCTRHDLRGQLSCRASQLETVFELVRLGLGVSLVPEMAVRGRPDDGLRYVPLRRNPPRRDIGIATRLGRTRSLLADRFAALVELEVGRLAA